MADIPSPSTAGPISSESSQRITPIHASNSESIIRISPHATIPTSQSQSQSSQETLALISGPIRSSRGGVDGNKCEESRKTFDLKNSRVEYCEPENIIHVEAATVVGAGDGSSNLQSDSSVDPVAAKESTAIGMTGNGNGNGKRKIMRKTVRLVKKVIKKRVLKRVLASGSENHGVVMKAEDGVNLSEVRDNLDLDNDVNKKSNVVDEVVEKTSVIDEENNVLSMIDDVKESSNPVNENSDHVDKVTEKTSIFDEVMENENITDEIMQELGNATNVSEPIVGNKSEDPSGIAYMESDRSKLNFIANSSEKMVPVNDLSGINTMETSNIGSNDVVSEVEGNNLTIRVPALMEVEKVNNISGTSMKTKEIENSKMENQSQDFIVETEKIDIVNKVDMELLSIQNVGPVGEKGETTIGKAESGSEVDSDRIYPTERLLASGAMEALERTKRSKTEIFVGGLDRNTQEDDIRKVFGEAGVIVEIRLMMSNSGKNRGYAFVRFATAADAKNALENYSKVKICGKQCNIAPVEGNDTIFLGNIDRNWKTEDVVALLERGGIDKIDKVTLKADQNNIEKNRGFAFVEFETCKDAQTAFNKLQKKDVFGKKQMVKAAWARPLSEPAEEEILQVKSVCAEHLPSSWDKEKVKDYFKRFGEIESVALDKDLASSRRKAVAFIYYKTRDAALTCIESVNRERLEDGCSKVKMAVSLAKPVSSKTKQMKHTSDLSSKQLFEAKWKTFETSKKQHDPRNQGKTAISSYNHVMVDKRSSTTDELVQILRQQASNKHILSHPRTGIDIPDYHFPLPGSKRRFSLSGHDPLYVEHQDFSRLRVGSLYPISGPSSSSHGVGMLSSPYHHRQVPGFTSESVNERRTYPSHFQKREEAPYYSENNMHRRRE